MLGIVGGIISSVIVSRVFVIQSNHQQQADLVSIFFRRVNYIRGVLDIIRKAQELSYDAQVKKEKEMNEMGYVSEAEYYDAHKEIDWVDEKPFINKLLEESKEKAKEILEDMMVAKVSEASLLSIVNSLNGLLNDIYCTKEMSFKTLSMIDKKCVSLFAEYDQYKKQTNVELATAIRKDKVLQLLAVLLLVLVVLLILSFIFKW